MAFIVHTLTNLGASMIASATVGNKMIISGCALSTTQYTESAAQQMNSIPGDSPWTTRISAASVDNRVEARATFLRSQGAQTGGNWYSMILFGRMSNDGIAVLKPIAVIVSDSEFYIPEVDSSISDVSVVFSLGFGIDYNTIQVPVETVYALNSAFETLKDITVTTHNFNDPSIGDSQDIKGNKYFVKPIGSDLGLESSENTVNGNHYIMRSSKFEAEIDTFRHIIAESHDTTNEEYRGVYLDKDDTDEMTFTTDAEHVYFPGLVSDRTEFYYIGCIAMIAVSSPVAPNPDRYEVGATIQYQNGVLVIYAASWDPSTNQFDIAKDTNNAAIELQNMKFKLITQCRLVQMGTTICIAMRVE